MAAAPMIRICVRLGFYRHDSVGVHIGGSARVLLTLLDHSACRLQSVLASEDQDRDGRTADNPLPLSEAYLWLNVSPQHVL